MHFVSQPLDSVVWDRDLQALTVIPSCVHGCSVDFGMRMEDTFLGNCEMPHKTQYVIEGILELGN